MAVWQWPYSAFGSNKPAGVLKVSIKAKTQTEPEKTLVEGAVPAQESNLRMAGQYFDEEAGSFYNYLRTYDAASGKFTQADPMGMAGGMNRYNYVKGNPLRYTDPRGLKVVFTGSSATQAALQSAYNDVASTLLGSQLTKALEDSSIVYTITNQENGNAYFDPTTNIISVDPNFHPPTNVDTGSACALQPAPTRSGLACLNGFPRIVTNLRPPSFNNFKN